MAAALSLLQPLLLLALLGLWLYCIQDALRNHRSWWWVLAVLLLPVASAPVYLLNFKMLGGHERGRIDQHLGDTARLRALREQAEVNSIPAAHEELAEIYMRRGELVSALNHLKRVLEHDADDLRAQYLAGAALVSLGKPAQALPHLEFVLEADPRAQFGLARLALANAHLALGDEDRALTELAETTRQHLIPEATVRHARLLRKHGERERARAELREMLRRVQDIPDEILSQQKPWIRQAAEELKALENELRS